MRCAGSKLISLHGPCVDCPAAHAQVTALQAPISAPTGNVFFTETSGCHKTALY